MTRWDGIDECVAVAAAGSFAGGARRMGVSISHVSRAVARLEDRLGIQLFARTTRTVALTDAGRALVARFQLLVEERDEALALASSGHILEGELRLTCSVSLGERFVAPIARRYAQDHPKLAVSLDLTNRLVDLVAEGYDLAIRTGQLADSRLVRTRIAARRFHLCAAPAYLDRMGRPRVLSDLAGHDCLIGTTPIWHFRVDGSDQVFRPKGRWRCNSGVAIADAALAGMGLCQLPEFYVFEHLVAGRLECVLDGLRVQDEPVWAVYPQRRHLPLKVSALVQRLKAELGPVLTASDARESAG